MSKKKRRRKPPLGSGAQRRERNASGEPAILLRAIVRGLRVLLDELDDLCDRMS